MKNGFKNHFSMNLNEIISSKKSEYFPNIIVKDKNVKALDQAYDYGSFLKNRFASETGFSKVVCYVVGGEKNTSDYKFKDKEETYIKSGDVFVKTYRELLEQSKEYHKEFIDMYNEYNN